MRDLSPQEFMRKWGPLLSPGNRTSMASDLGSVCTYWEVERRYGSGQRLKKIAEIIECVDDRAMHVDGPVTPTRQEITDEEYREIYRLAKGIYRLANGRLSNRGGRRGR